MAYRDATPRVSIAQVRTQFTPRTFHAMASIRLELGGIVGEVALVDAGGTGAVTRARRWFVCPRCQRRANVLGAIEGLGWVCPRCGAWRSRNRRRAVAGDSRISSRSSA